MRRRGDSWRKARMAGRFCSDSVIPKRTYSATAIRYLCQTSVDHIRNISDERHQIPNHNSRELHHCAGPRLPTYLVIGTSTRSKRAFNRLSMAALRNSNFLGGLTDYGRAKEEEEEKKTFDTSDWNRAPILILYCTQQSIHHCSIPTAWKHYPSQWKA